MHFPATFADMLCGGYVFLKTKPCTDCRMLVYLFRTPRARRAPFVKTPADRFVSHFALCPAARIRHADATRPGQGELFPIDVVASLAPRA